MWNIPGPGIEPTSHELAGRFSTTGPPEKSPGVILLELLTKVVLVFYYSFHQHVTARAQSPVSGSSMLLGLKCMSFLHGRAAQ